MKKIYYLIIILIISNNKIKAQIFDGTRGTRPNLSGIFKHYDGNADGKNSSSESIKSNIDHKNFLKINLYSLGFSTLSAQYERIVSQSITVAMGVRFGLNNVIKFPSNYGRSVDSSFYSAIGNIKIQNYAITPEVRIYPFSAGRSIYIAAFGRYENFNGSLPIKFTLESGKKLDGTFKIDYPKIGGGLMLGWQIRLTKQTFFDWWLGGVYGGSAKLSMSYEDANLSLNTNEIQDIKNKVNANVGPYEFRTEATSTKITLSDQANPLSLRVGFCFGVRF